MGDRDRHTFDVTALTYPDYQAALARINAERVAQGLGALALVPQASRTLEEAAACFFPVRVEGAGLDDEAFMGFLGDLWDALGQICKERQGGYRHPDWRVMRPLIKDVVGWSDNLNQ